MLTVKCLETGAEYGFLAATGYEAMNKMKYMLDVANRDDSAVINKTISGEHLWMEHHGLTYAVKN